MITTSDHPVSTPQLSRPLTRIILFSLLTCGSVVTPAFAKCFQDLPQSLATPAVSAAAIRFQNPIVESGAPDNSASIVGLWKLTVTSGGQTVDVGFDAWHSDGTEILNDYTNPIEGNVCLGVWKQVGPRTYKLKHPSWFFDTTGTLLGTVVIRETVHLSADGNSYAGTYTYDIYDVSGAFVEELTGELSATRIRPD